MRQNPFERPLRLPGLLLLALLAGGCSRSVAVLDAQEEASPLMRRARLQANSGNVDAAIRLYKAAIENNERLARAHLDLALLLNDHKKDYVRAIYHYQRYLELRPEAEKKELIEDRIRLAGQQFAAAFLRRDKADAEKAALEKELAELKQTNQRLQDDLARLQAELQAARPEAGRREPAPAPRETAAQTRPAAGGPAPPPAAADRLRTYRVKRGDTLMRIAAEVYGDSAQWKRIQDANRALLGGSSAVKVGQVLVIP